MRILLVDDEAMMLELLEEAAAEVLPKAEKGVFRTAREALEYAEEKTVDIAFLDINIPVMNGLDLAKHITDLYPKANIVFCTGYREYADAAFDMYASGYLVKPITADKLRKALEHLRYPVDMGKRLRFHCFGNFEAYCDGRPINFDMKRTDELLAYLVDREGTDCSAQEIMAVLFEDDQKRRYYNYLRNDLIQTFEKLGLGDCLRVTRGSIGIERDKVDCDYFDYKDGKVTQKPTEYMTQFSFGEETLAGLL